MESNNSNLDDKETSESFHKFSEDTKSPLKKYQDLIIGNRNLISLISYEFCTLFLMHMPALPGLFLRQKFYRFLFKKLGRNSTFGVGITLKQPGKITIGNNCAIDDLVHLSARGDETCQITLKNKIFVGRGTEIKLRHGKILICDNVSIGSYCRIAANIGSMDIGKDVIIAAYCYIGGGNHRTDRTDMPIAHQGFESKGGVSIGNDVWIGANSVIADGVKIGDGAIIGACSYVNRDIPAYSIAFGAPAKIAKSRK